MKTTVQARLDPAAQQALNHLARQTGWKPSRIVREALRRMAGARPRPPLRIIGQGRFDSGIADLGSNPEHLRGLGQ